MLSSRPALGALALALLPHLPLGAQEPPGEQGLIDRIRQIQGQLAPERGGAAESNAPTEERLIERLQTVREEIGRASAPEAPALDETEVSRRISEELGVDVLDIRPVRIEKGPAYAVTVMNPPGNYNAAFMVGTLLVDGATGELLGEAAPTRPETSGGPGAEIRRRTFR